ncbi:hypothetical protein Lalb_Chr04g0249881 [Lupinus albus]|uniref:Clavata3/ESR (CLE) gene family member n=1 Tax=Lupinus albus TaxID=3870 RepID=A0A6A4QMT6_LUPAL|nr:hypothetical protein Lalb_Chr04g0249881 [Lupinus albus]
MNMKHFNLLLFLIILFLTPKIHAIKTKFSGPSTSRQQVFHPWANISPISSRGSRKFKSEKRKVPSGPNPLHNKR